MRNLIVSIVLIAITKGLYGQLFFTIDTLRFTADSSYARGFTRMHDNLIFGTSKTGIISYNEQTNTATTLFPAMPEGEFRDVLEYQNQLYTITSGKSGFLVLVNAQNPAILYNDTAAFYDDLAANKSNLVLLGDPIDSTFLIRCWKKNSMRPSSITIPVLPNEACYAASGTTSQFLPNGDYAFVSGGGSVSRFHVVDLEDSSTVSSIHLPMKNGQGAGPFSFCFTSRKKGIIVGGDYTLPNETVGTACFTLDGGKSWTASQTNGYRSCVVGNRQLLFACGTNGIDYSNDGGKTWKILTKGNFCTLRLEKSYLYATTNKGYCIRIHFNKKSLRKI